MFLLWPPSAQAYPNFSSSQASQSWQSGPWQLDWDRTQNQLQLWHQNSLAPILTNPPGASLLSAAQGQVNVRENRGSFKLDFQAQSHCSEQRVEAVGLDASQNFVIQGHLEAQPGGSSDACHWPYRITLQPEQRADFYLKLEVAPPANRSDLQTRLEVHLRQTPKPIYGGGIQPSLFELSGQRIPLWVQEGGIGRGAWPVTPLLSLFSPGSEGSKSSSYFPLPLFWQAESGHSYRAWELESSAPGELDFSQPSETVISQYSSRMQLQSIQASSPLNLLSQIQHRHPPATPQATQIPDWLHRGAIVGLQGGSQKVEAIWQELKRRGTPISAFWLQDWVGRRRTVIGSQLWWNWERDSQRYPDWDHWRSELAQHDIRLLGYLNPYLVDVSGHPHQRNLYREAAAQGFLIHRAGGEPYSIQNTDFAAGMLDLSNPQARNWFQEVVETELIEKAGFSGWMADYAEGLPLDARMAQGSAWDEHNAYPVQWSQLNAQILSQGAEPCQDCVFFTRSGYLGSTMWTPFFWLGDQMTDWSPDDGLPSALTGMLSAGLSGIPLVHADAGGYTAIAQLGLTRSRELLQRWLEFSAFTPLLRTHEGSQPEANQQIYSDQTNLDFFDRMARVYAALFNYRKQLFAEAHQHGWPVVRPLLLHYPNDPHVSALKDEFMLGSELLVAPVLTPGSRSRRLYLPAGQWIHLWSQKKWGEAQQGRWVQVDAPLGAPPAFYRQGSLVGQKLYRDLSSAGLISP